MLCQLWTIIRKLQMHRLCAIILGCSLSLILYNTTILANSLNVRDASLRQVIFMVARQGNFNLIIGDDITGDVTLQLHNLTPYQMLSYLSQAYGLKLEKTGDFWRIGKDERNLRRIEINYLNLDKAAQIAQLILDKPAKTNVMPKTKKQNNDAANESEIVTTTNKSKRSTKNSKPESNRNFHNANVIVDREHNCLTFIGSEADFQKLQQYFKTYDRAPHQILLEAKVTAISKDDQEKLGIEWEWSKIPQVHAPITTTKRDKDTENNNSSTNDLGGQIHFGHSRDGSPYEWNFAATLDAMIMHGKAKILARPNIMTLQGEEATINIGSEVPVPKTSTTDSTTTTSIDYRQAGIILRCTPRVNKRGEITVEVHTEVSSPMYVSDLKAYRFQKRSADTMVRLQDGETMVIGGLIGADEAKTMSKVPFLGDIPILGQFFRHVSKTKSNNEVMIFLTAHQID